MYSCLSFHNAIGVAVNGWFFSLREGKEGRKGREGGAVGERTAPFKHTPQNPQAGDVGRRVKKNLFKSF